MAKVKSMGSSRLVYLLCYLTMLSAINYDNQRLTQGDVLLAALNLFFLFPIFVDMKIYHHNSLR